MTSILEILETKKRGGVLTEEQIRFWIDGVAKELIPLYQTTALLMAIRLNGMSFEEAAALTTAMVDSGERLTFSGYPVICDKHSTGGIGDKVTLILAPLVAACGLPVTMLSGRGLGHTGGTIDKLEALQGVGTTWTRDQMQAMIDTFGWTNARASQSIVPADRILYALRDVTATVDSVPLITASVLSKKIAGGANHLVLDVKCGSGAFMQDLEQAGDLAHHLKEIGQLAGLKVFGFITRMEEPLGHAVGNYPELWESVQYLKKRQYTPLEDLVFRLGEAMLINAGLFSAQSSARDAMIRALESGEGLRRLEAYLDYCGADASALNTLLKQDLTQEAVVEIRAPRSGRITAIAGRRIGEFMVDLGAGRLRSEDDVDPTAGFIFAKHVGDEVAEGDLLLRVYGSKAKGLESRMVDLLPRFVEIGDEVPTDTDLILREF